MCDFKPGDEVVCIRTDTDVAFPPVVGQHYTVAETLAAGCGRDGWHVDRESIQLVEIGHYETDWDYGFDAACFRKVQRRDLTAWLATRNTVEGPVRAPVEETA